jgi:hypothetical protein
VEVILTSPNEQMKIEYKDIEEAVEFVSAGHMSMHSAVVDMQTGTVLFQAESGDLDEFPEDVDDERYRAIPGKNDLRLGRPLVMSYIQQHIPDAYQEVQRMFARSGAYSRFKAFLEARNRLDHWYEYEGQETEKAIREWCREQGIELMG